MPRGQDPSRPLISQYASDPEMADLVELFVGELPERIRALESAWQDQRVEAVTRIAHQLKGSGAGYGFPLIGDAAANLESKLRHQALSDAEAALAKASEDFRALVDLCARACRRVA